VMNKNLNEVEILFVEDNMSDAALVIRALRRVTSPISVHFHDSADALDFIFGAGVFTKRAVKKVSKVILPDIELPGVV
jgi:CheY-like chemotaxis protein